MVAFFRKVKSSIYDPGFYRSLAKTTAGKTYLYFLLLILCIAIVNTAKFLPIAPLVNQTARDVVSMAKDKYPQELVVTVKDGLVNTNVQEPYFVKLPDEVKDDDSMHDDVNLITIDTKTPFSVKQYTDYNTIAWITKDSIIYPRDDDGNQLQIVPLTEVKDLKIDKNLVDSTVNKINPYLGSLGPIIVVLIFFGTFLAYQFRLLYLLVAALLIWLVTKLLKKKYSYGLSYKTGVYAMTLPIILETIIGIWNQFNPEVKFPQIPFFFTLVMLLVVLINLKDQDSK